MYAGHAPGLRGARSFPAGYGGPLQRFGASVFASTLMHAIRKPVSDRSRSKKTKSGVRSVQNRLESSLLNGLDQDQPNAARTLARASRTLQRSIRTRLRTAACAARPHKPSRRTV